MRESRQHILIRVMFTGVLHCVYDQFPYSLYIKKQKQNKTTTNGMPVPYPIQRYSNQEPLTVILSVISSAMKLRLVEELGGRVKIH